MSQETCQDTLKGPAYHEAGHALLQTIFGNSVVDVSIEPQSEWIAGVCKSRHPHQVELDDKGVYYEGTKERDQWICHNIMSLLAGEVAQTEFCPESVTLYDAASDQRKVQQWIKAWEPQFSSQAEREQKIDDLRQETGELIRYPECTAAIHALAAALLEKRRLSGAEARAIIARTLGGKRIECPHCLYARYDDD